jgi:DNA-binding NtrC family response regulator
LQDGTYQAIGDPRERSCDVRLVAATNANLEKQVAEGTFRSDLYYRLKILDLAIPPLRERREDILPLLRHFLSLAAGHHVDLAEYFNRPSLVAAENFEWPGNVREIAMVARRAHIDLQARGRVEVRIPAGDETLIMTGPRLDAMEAEAGGMDMVPVKKSDSAERSRILLALEESGGSRVDAAKALGMGRSTLYRRMVRLGIPTRRA